ELIIRKGYRQHMDSYSAFFEADGKSTTGLSGYVKDRGCDNLYFVGLAGDVKDRCFDNLCLGGLATDFCVCWSALDARKVGLQAAVIEDACRGIDTGGSLGKAWADMQKAGVKRMQSGELAT